MTKPRPCVVIDLLSLGRMFILPGEVGPILMHRHVLASYLVALFGLMTLDFNGVAGRMPVELRGTVYIFSIASCMAVVALSMQLAMAIAARRGRVRFHLSPVLMLGTLGSVLVGEGLFRFLVATADSSVLRLVLLFGFNYLFAEFAAAILAHRVLPLILSELRGLPIGSLAETDPALWADSAPAPAPSPAPSPAPAPAATGTGFILSGDRSLPLAGLMHLQAEGNYVHLWATDRHELLPGPLADLVRQIPPEQGRLVHRSHWVAASAVQEWQAKGRDITLRLANGQSVPVAVTRRHEMRDWLESLGLPQAGRP